ncbi:uncharacterized protein LOC135689732 [Rhopilema esculentum]|uniref:uncharacterized protein LOC135689732 n=1 Tax=Rhopilema esculentum TaxID=499914 RepID=UPI0031D3E857
MASVVKEFQALRNCQKLKITDVKVKAGSLFGVAVSQDKQSLVLRLHPAVPLHGLGLQTFDYTAELQPGGNITISAKVTIDARLYIRNSTVTSRCPHGRMWVPGMPVPAKTEKRTFNGFSNNMENLFWGAASENLRRLVPNNYLDDIAMPAGTCT